MSTPPQPSGQRSGSTTGAPSSIPRANSARKLYPALIGVSAAAFLILAAIAVVPILHSFSFAIYCTPVTHDYPSGAAVTVNWVTHTGGIADLLVVHLVNYSRSGQSVIYDTKATSGSFTFQAQVGQYIYSATGNCPDVYGSGPPLPVNISGDWSSPLL